MHCSRFSKYCKHDYVLGEKIVCEVRMVCGREGRGPESGDSLVTITLASVLKIVFLPIISIVTTSARWQAAVGLREFNNILWPLAWPGLVLGASWLRHSLWINASIEGHSLEPCLGLGRATGRPLAISGQSERLAVG